MFYAQCARSRKSSFIPAICGSVRLLIDVSGEKLPSSFQ
jgi:hypothetical protein